MMAQVRTFLRDESGLSVLEYVLGAGILVTALLLIFTNWGAGLQAKLDAVAS